MLGTLNFKGYEILGPQLLFLKYSLERVLQCYQKEINQDY